MLVKGSKDETRTSRTKFPVAVEQQIPADSSQVEERSSGTEPLIESPGCWRFFRALLLDEPAELHRVTSRLLKTISCSTVPTPEKSEAEKLMQENAGSILHVDYIIRSVWWTWARGCQSREAQDEWFTQERSGKAVGQSRFSWLLYCRFEVGKRSGTKKGWGQAAPRTKAQQQGNRGKRYRDLSFTGGSWNCVRDRSGGSLTWCSSAACCMGELEGEALR